MNLNEHSSLSEAKRTKLRRLRIAMIAIGLLLVGTIAYAATNGSAQKADVSDVPHTVLPTPVHAVLVDDLGSQTAIKTSGVITAQTQVDVVALGAGTIRSLLFEVGDTVVLNQLLASLQDTAVSTNLNTAQSSYQNAQNSLQSTNRSTDDAIRSAEINVENATVSVRSAEIALETAQDNLQNNIALTLQSNENSITNAIIGHAGDMNALNDALTQINTIIHADETQPQLSGIAPTLGVINSASLTSAKAQYWSARNAFDVIRDTEATTESIQTDLRQLLSVLALTKQAVASTLTVLDNTIPNSSFSESALNAQKSKFTALRASLVAEQSTTQVTLQTLQNIDINTKTTIDALENAVTSAENKLQLAEIAYNNAINALSSAREGKTQQLVSAQTSVDTTQGQLRLARTQVADLSVRTPISGVVTQRYVEKGAEVSPGQKIATVAQTDLVKIKVSLASEDIYRVRVGDTVLINDTFEGTLTKIDPSADPFSRKVGAEVRFDNSNKDLITETFATVTIPISPLATVQEQSFFVPIKAVVVSTTGSYVFIVNDGIAKKVPVTTGNIDGIRIEVLEGLMSDDLLVIEGGKKLADGAVVVVE